VTRLFGVTALFLAASLHGQAFQPEVRLDGFGSRPYSLEPGIGIGIPLGNYVRASVGGGYALPLESSLDGERWRAEALGRFTFDPFRQRRWGLSIGGGVTYRRSRTYLAAIADLEGPAIRGFLPAIQGGVSGGARVGLVLRKAVAGRR
jgi:hypothetical protein